MSKNVLITAGPTREPIDPVRYISNRSSGKMGYAIAKAFAEAGHNVKLISGSVKLEVASSPTNCHPACPPEHSEGGKERSDAVPAGRMEGSPLITMIKIETAEEMRNAVMAEFEWADIIIMAAAVADFRPKVVSEHKIKKNLPLSQRGLPAGRRGIEGDFKKESNFYLELERTPDILKELGEKKRKDQILVGFALETENLIENAKKKLEEKNLDLIIANNTENFGNDNADVVLIDENGENAIKATPKENFAKFLIDRLL